MNVFLYFMFDDFEDDDDPDGDDEEEDDDNNDDADSDHDMILVILSFSNYTPARNESKRQALCRRVQTWGQGLWDSRFLQFELFPVKRCVLPYNPLRPPES